MKEYRAASKQYGAEGGITSADDRILHCCLYFTDKLNVGKVEAGTSETDEGGGSDDRSHREDKERRRLVLLSNDTMLRNKVHSSQLQLPLWYFK